MVFMFTAPLNKVLVLWKINVWGWWCLVPGWFHHACWRGTRGSSTRAPWWNCTRRPLCQLLPPLILKNTKLMLSRAGNQNTICKTGKASARRENQKLMSKSFEKGEHWIHLFFNRQPLLQCHIEERLSRRVWRRVTSKPCWRRPDCASSPFGWLTTRSHQCKWSPQLPHTASGHSWVIAHLINPGHCQWVSTWSNPSIPQWLGLTLGQSCQPLPKGLKLNL